MKYQADKFVKVVSSLLPASRSGAGAVNGTGVDTKGFSEALVILHAGTNAASATNDVKVQDSADDSTYADISGATFTQITTSNDNDIYVGRINLRQSGVDRYIRAVATDATDAVVSGVTILLLGAYALPVSQVNTAEFSI